MKTLILLLTILSLTINLNAQNKTLNDLLDFEDLGYNVGQLVQEIESEDGCYVRFKADDINTGTGFYYTKYYDNTGGSGSGPLGSFGYQSSTQPENIECKSTYQSGHITNVNKIKGSGYGCYFLSALRLEKPGKMRRLFVIFSTPVSMVSGEILDIDGGESWTVFAYKNQNSVPSNNDIQNNTHLSSFSLPVTTGTQLDSRGSKFVLASQSSFSVVEIRLKTTGTSLGGFGLDNLKFCGRCCK